MVPQSVTAHKRRGTSFVWISRVGLAFGPKVRHSDRHVVFRMHLGRAQALDPTSNSCEQALNSHEQVEDAAARYSLILQILSCLDHRPRLYTGYPLFPGENEAVLCDLLVPLLRQNLASVHSGGATGLYYGVLWRRVLTPRDCRLMQDVRNLDGVEDVMRCRQPRSWTAPHESRCASPPLPRLPPRSTSL